MNPFRNLPAVNDVLATAVLGEALTQYPRAALVATIRDELDQLRRRLTKGEAVDGEAGPDALAARVVVRLTHELRPKLRAVINATGIVLHTNLGRAPLGEHAARAAYEAARGYLNLELDLDSGKRSSRQSVIREWVCRLTGAESATAVNNNAAATVLVLRAPLPGQGSRHLARPAHRDRRQFPHPRDHGRQRSDPARSRHHEHHAPRRLRGAPSARTPGRSCRSTPAITACPASRNRSPWRT